MQTKRPEKTELVLARAETIKNNLVTYKQFNKATQELHRLQDSRGSLTLQLLFESLDSHERDRTMNKAIETAESEAHRALLIIESELGL